MFHKTEHLKLLSAFLSFQGVCWLDVKVPPGLPGAPNCFYAMKDLRIDIHQSPTTPTTTVEIDEELKDTPTTPSAIDNLDEILRDVDELINSENHDSEKNKDVSSSLSFFSNRSVPLDTYLLTHAQNLRSEVDLIKINICSILKLEVNKFAVVTPLMIKSCSSLNKSTLAEGLLSILGLAENVCAVVSGQRCDSEVKSPSYLSVPSSMSMAMGQTTPESSSLQKSLEAIQISIKNLKENDSHLKTLDSINNKLAELKLDINCFKNSRSSNVSTPDLPTPPFNIGSPAPCETDHEDHEQLLSDAQKHPKVDDPKSKHIISYVPKFVDAKLNSDLSVFLDQQKEAFDNNSENGHGVLSFGEPYQYPGAKAEKPIATDFPEALAVLVSKIKEEYPGSTINQCLINRYTDENSFLPKHSDNEQSLVHDSSIFTVSLGDECSVKFTKKGQPEGEVVETIEGCSLYVMSKQSQFLWDHRIDKSTEKRDLRYSITFRYISSSTNTTLIIGDSNTRYLRFGSGKGTFGHRLPGRRIECFTIDKLDPTLCVGYKNIIVHCGINNIKNDGGNVKYWAHELNKKLKTISELCPYAKIVASPILPTRSALLNERAIEFNRFLCGYCETNSRIGTLDFNSFLDKDGLLDQQFIRYKKPDDPIHLGSNGIFKLSRTIAHKIFGNPVDGRLFSAVAKAHLGRFSPRPRRSIRQS